jgi:hypothetical protein
MEPKAKVEIVTYLPDGSFSLDDVRRRLEPHGVTLDLPLPAGGVRFVPDDPTFPTTIFTTTRRIEFHLQKAESPRLEEYLKNLSAWLQVGFKKA